MESPRSREPFLRKGAVVVLSFTLLVWAAAAGFAHGHIGVEPPKLELRIEQPPTLLTGSQSGRLVEYLWFSGGAPRAKVRLDPWPWPKPLLLETDLSLQETIALRFRIYQQEPPMVITIEQWDRIRSAGGAPRGRPQKIICELSSPEINSCVIVPVPNDNGEVGWDVFPSISVSPGDHYLQVKGQFIDPSPFGLLAPPTATWLFHFRIHD